MEQAQRTYFLQRLSEIAAEKLQAKAVELFGPTGRPEQPTWGQVFEAIRSGEITLKAGTESLTRPYLMPTDVEWPALTQKQEQLAAYRVQLETQRKAAEDAAMLDESAQAALSKFQAV